MKKPGSAETNNTGTWKTFSPHITEKCTGCGICAQYCPEGGIRLIDQDGKKKAVIAEDHCKGCMICFKVCPVKAIKEVREK